MIERVRRAFHPAGAATGAVVTLDEEESHHLLRVLRLRAGDPVEVFDGRGSAWRGTFEGSAGATASVRIGEALGGSTDPDLRVVLHQGLCRPEKLEWVVQKGTEIGVAAFDLIAAARAEAGVPSPSRVDRLRRIVVEACKQSGRRRLPEILGPSPIPGRVAPGAAAFALHPSAGALPLGASLAGERPSAAHFAVGPEGGFEPSEIEALEAAGWVLAGLGPRTLRTETAGLVAATIALHRWSDLGSEPSSPAPSRGTTSRCAP